MTAEIKVFSTNSMHAVLDELVPAFERASGNRVSVSYETAMAMLKRMLLNAKSVAYTLNGASGIHFAGLIERLGIAGQVKAKAVTRPGGLIAELVIAGATGVSLDAGFRPGVQSEGTGTRSGISELRPSSRSLAMNCFRMASVLSMSSVSIS